MGQGDQELAFGHVKSGMSIIHVEMLRRQLDIQVWPTRKMLDLKIKLGVVSE